MIITLNTDDGLIVPPGSIARLEKGGLQIVRIQLLEAGSAVETDPEELVVGLRLPGETAPLAVVEDWEYQPSGQFYQGTLDTASGALAWLPGAVLLGRVDQGGQTGQPFHVRYGAPGAVTAVVGGGVTVNVTQLNTGPYNYLMLLPYHGELTEAQVFGGARVVADGHIYGAQVSAQVAPEGDDVVIDLVDAGGEPLGRSVTLPDGLSLHNTEFAVPLAVPTGMVVRGRVAQHGSGVAGSWLSINLMATANSG